MNSIDPENLSSLKAEVDALDRLPPSLEVLERMVKLIAERFSIAVTASRRESGKPVSVTYLDFKYGSPARSMSVKFEDGRYHCFHQLMADQYDSLETATSSVAWYYLVGLPYPRLWKHASRTPG